MPASRQIKILRPVAFLLAFLLALGGASFAMAATQQENLHGAIKDFEAMTQDQKRGMWRESWEKLEKRFAAIEAQGKDYAAEAYFYQARSREELSDRSRRQADYQSAVQLYKTFVSRYKNHPLADNACYNQAMLLSGPLGNKAAAAKLLDTAIANYPDGDMFSDSIMLRERLRPGSNGVSGGTAGSTGGSAGASGQKPSTSSSSGTGNSTATPAHPKPSSSAVEKQKQLYAAASSQWRTLLVDNKKGGLRESWLNLEKAFEGALKAAPGGPDAHKAAFQMARCREELAQRSANQSDWQEALRLFQTMAADYPASSLADDSLYSQAEIMAQRLKNPTRAREILNNLLTNYPGGDMAPKARTLLNQLPAGQQGKPAGSSSDASSGSSSSGTSRPAPTPPAANISTQKISGSSGNHNTKASANEAKLRHVEWNGDGDRLLVTLEMAGRAKYRRATLAADPAKNLPQRVRIDLLTTGLDNNLRQSIVLTGAPVAAINTSKQSGNITRVELDLAAARSYKVSVLQNPYRLQIEVQSSRLISGGEDLDKIRPVSRPSSTSNGNIVEQLGLNIRTIMIDAGHGGKDPGAVGNGLRESTITLDLAQKLGEELKKKGFTVLYTRDSNRFVELADRTSMANSKKADVFVSIHVNASTNKGLHGLETYYLDVARSDAARVVAAKENSVDVGRTSDLQFILSDLTRNSKKEESLALSKQVQAACITRLKNQGFQTRNNGVRSAPFYVLMGARMPAFLIEIGYLSHSSEASRIKNPKYIQAIASGITEGIVAYQKQLNRLAR